jgi:hypothetical protein
MPQGMRPSTFRAPQAASLTRLRASRFPLLNLPGTIRTANATHYSRLMRSFLRVFFVFWIAAAALVVVALALAALKTIALVASASLYNALLPIVPGGGSMAWLIWGLVLGIVVLPVFASCVVIVFGISRMLKGWPFRASSSAE